MGYEKVCMGYAFAMMGLSAAAMVLNLYWSRYASGIDRVYCQMFAFLAWGYGLVFLGIAVTSMESDLLPLAVSLSAAGWLSTVNVILDLKGKIQMLLQ